MQSQQLASAVLSTHSKIDEKIIDPQKIKSLLSKKLPSSHVSNPQQMLNHLEDHIHSQIQKFQAAIHKNKQRQNKIKTIQTRQLRSRSLLQQKLKLKLQRSSKKKITEDKQKLQSKIATRKLKEQLFNTRKQQIHQTQFRKRLEKFKSIKAQNLSYQQNPNLSPSQIKKSNTLKRSFSVRSSLEGLIQKKKQIEQIQYFKTLQTLQKRRIFQKAQKIISLPQRTDKTQWIQKINSQTQDKYIQKLGFDLWKIQQARRKKQKSLTQKINKLKKQFQFKEEQRSYKIQIIKQQTHAKIKTHRQILNKKNQRFLTMRNKSVPHLQRNFSNISQNRDTFQMNIKQGFIDSTNKMSKTLENFKQLKNRQIQKVHQYYQKQKQHKLKKDLKSQLDQILKKQKIEQLLK